MLDKVSTDGGFWISDEYGPFVYHFNKQGNMTVAIKPPKAVIPYRNGDPRFVDLRRSGGKFSPGNRKHLAKWS